MIGLIVYSTLDGEIRKYVLCPSGMADLQCGEDEAYIEHDRVDDSKFKVDLETLEIIPIP